MRETDGPLSVDDKGTGHLHDITHRRGGVETPEGGADASEHNRWPQHLVEAALSQRERTVRLVIGVGEAGKRRSAFAAEPLRLLRRPLCDDAYLSARGIELVFILTQLRQMFLAEWSTEVSQEDEDGVPL